MEACGNSGWFERMVQAMGHELWLGDAGTIRSLVVRKQKTDRRDAEHVWRLPGEGRFPRIWVPSPGMRDSRQLLLQRHKLVQMRTRVKNELQQLALNQGVQQKRKLWTQAGRKQLESLPLQGWTEQRRDDLLQMLDDLEARIGKLDTPVGGEAEGEPTTPHPPNQPPPRPRTTPHSLTTTHPPCAP